MKDGETPPPYELKTKHVTVNSREEHEAILNDPKKCEELGLDIMFENMVYLKRWGGWLHEQDHIVDPNEMVGK